MEDFSLAKEILAARSPAVVSGWNHESIMHAAGDMVSDIVWLGNIAADIRVYLNNNYHKASMCIVKQVIASA